MDLSSKQSILAIGVCGCGQEGRLGLGPHAPDVLAQITLLPDFLPLLHEDKQTAPRCGRPLQLRTGGYHTLVLTSLGVFGWGANESGQLGLGENAADYCARPTRLDFFDSMTWEGRGEGEQQKKETESEREWNKSVERIVQMTCGALHSMVLTDRAVYVCGSNVSGQLGLGHEESPVRRWTQLCVHNQPVTRERIFDCDPNSLNTHNTNNKFNNLARMNLNADGNEEDGPNDEVQLQTLREFNETYAHGVFTHVSAGTSHSLLAWRSSNGNVRLLAAGKGDFGELGYDADVAAVLWARDRRRQAAIVRAQRAASLRGELTHTHEPTQNYSYASEEEAAAVYETRRSERTTADTSEFDRGAWLGEGGEIAKKTHPCAGWVERQRAMQPRPRRPAFQAALFHPVQWSPTFETGSSQDRQSKNTDNSPHTTDPSQQSTFRLMDTNKDNRSHDIHCRDKNTITNINFRNSTSGNDPTCSVEDLSAMHLHSSVRLRVGRKRLTFHWGCGVGGVVEGPEAAVPQLLEDEKEEAGGTAGVAMHAGEEVFFRFTPFDHTSTHVTPVPTCETTPRSVKNTTTPETSTFTAIKPTATLLTTLSNASGPAAPSEVRAPFLGLQQVCVIGEGRLGLPNLSVFSSVSQWTPIPGTAHQHAVVVGRSHFLFLLKGAPEKPTGRHHHPNSPTNATTTANTTIIPPTTTTTTRVIGFGENLHGQIGRPYAFGTRETGSKSLVKSSLEEGEAEVLLPHPVLEVGDALLASPLFVGVSAANRPNSRSCWVVDEILDVVAGARHSMFLLQVHLNANEG